MQCILLAAGYATRLYPLTKDKPKSLLDVSGKTILEHILKKVERIDSLSFIHIVTNDKFFKQFFDWSELYQTKKNIKIHNDGTTSNENRLGAIADIQYVIEQEGINEDILVLAGDNLFDFELTDFVDFFHDKGHDCITAYVVDNLDDLRRTGVVEIDQQGRAQAFVEKPADPKSNLAVPPFYIYKKETLELIKNYLNEGNNPDAPGNFIPWLIQHKDVYAFKFTGNRYDIGTKESYMKVKQIYGCT